MAPCPLQFRLLLECLTKLGAALVRDPDRPVFTVYELQEGYFGSPRGKRYPLDIRPDGQIVTVSEIRALLVHIGFAQIPFWDVAKELGAGTTQPTMTSGHNQGSSAAVLHDHSIVLCSECKRPLGPSEIHLSKHPNCAILN